MAVIIPQVITEDRASGAQVIDGSLRFDDSVKTNLGRTPGSVGNRKIFTWSGWTKRSQLGDTQRLMFVGDGSNYFSISFNNDTVQVEEAGGSNAFYVYTDALLRDTGWYHVAVTVDTTQDTQTNRVKVYVNGVDQALTAGNNWPPLNADLQINNTVDHRIGRNDADCFNGLLTNTYLIDGQALDASYFGFTDPLTNTWRPKKLNITTESLQPITAAPTLSNGALIIKAKGDSIGGLFESASGNLNYHSSSDGISWTRQSGGLSHVMPAAKYLAAGGSGTNNRTFTPNGTANEGYEYALWNTNTNFDVNSNPSGDTNVTSLTYTDRPGLGVFGTNGFWLPMDGNSPIGEDKSGNFNNWTPVNFGGSVALDNPQVSGAL